jgi:small subunit ribosomal protein S2
MDKKLKLLTINQLLNTKLHIGNLTVKWNFLLKSFLFGKRNGRFFFNLKYTMPFLRKAQFYLKRASNNHQVLLIIGVHPMSLLFIDYLNDFLYQASVTNKWVGGTLTNWLHIKPYVRFLYRTDAEQIRKKFELRTEKKIEQKINQYIKMKEMFYGIEKMPSVPNLIVTFEELDDYPLLESILLTIPLINIVNTDTKNLNTTFPLIGNDFLYDSLFFYANFILEAIKEGLKNRRAGFMKNFIINKPFNNRDLTYRRKFIKFFHNYIKYKIISTKKVVIRVNFSNQLKKQNDKKRF